MGRPKSDVQTRVVAVRVPLPEYELLAQIAAEDGVTLSDLMRASVRDWLHTGVMAEGGERAGVNRG